MKLVRRYINNNSIELYSPLLYLSDHTGLNCNILLYFKIVNLHLLYRPYTHPQNSFIPESTVYVHTISYLMTICDHTGKLNKDLEVTSPIQHIKS